MIKTSKVVESIQDNGGFIRTDEVAGRAEYEHIRKAIEDGTLVRVRQGVYAEQLALANTMIDVEKIVPGGIMLFTDLISAVIFLPRYSADALP